MDCPSAAASLPLDVDKLLQGDAMSPKQASTLELEIFYRDLDTQEKDEMLQCLLVAAAGGGVAMMAVLQEALLVRSVNEILTVYDSVAQTEWR